MILVGNKRDAENLRQVSLHDGMKMANKYFIPYVETSAKIGSEDIEKVKIKHLGLKKKKLLLSRPIIKIIFNTTTNRERMIDSDWPKQKVFSPLVCRAV